MSLSECNDEKWRKRISKLDTTRGIEIFLLRRAWICASATKKTRNQLSILLEIASSFANEREKLFVFFCETQFISENNAQRIVSDRTTDAAP